MFVSAWKRAVVLLLAVWLLVTYLLISPMTCGGGGDTVDYRVQLRAVSEQLEKLQQEHSHLVASVRRSAGISVLNITSIATNNSWVRTSLVDTTDANGKLKDIEPGPLYDSTAGAREEHEELRRRIYSNTKELWYFISHEVGKLASDYNKVDKLREILNQTADRKRSLLSDLEKLPHLDGYQEWRQMEANNVSDLIQRRLHHLQNPVDCREARKLICNMKKYCGFGSELHHLLYCLIFAYATERTLILNGSSGWKYNTKGWDDVFYPLSDTCTTSYDEKVTKWPDVRQSYKEVIQWPVIYDAKVISLPTGSYIAQKPMFLPQSVPKDLARRIMRFNGDPSSWWVGQIIKYVLKPRPKMHQAINETIAKMNFKKPIVGVHIRRTDKLMNEASFHHIHEYMRYVQEYYDKLELTRVLDARRVYLATDNANVLEEARKKYPAYEFISDPSIAKTTDNLINRYNLISLTGLLVDLHMLATCDYIVCTFSGSVCRTAYEMMQANRPDASASFFSLDDIYYFDYQNEHDREAVMRHTGGEIHGDITFEIGDLIEVAGNHWDGFGKGIHQREGQIGLFPWYKTTDHLVLYPFPEYKEVPLDKAHT